MLEDRDIIYIPRKTNLVSTFGYVNMPTYIPHSGKRLGYYVKMSGGFQENAEQSYFLIRKQNGMVLKESDWYKPEPGDEIIILPKISTKFLQIAKDIMQVTFQMAMTARLFFVIL
jgi:hypothetical protein